MPLLCATVLLLPFQLSPCTGGCQTMPHIVSCMNSLSTHRGNERRTRSGRWLCSRRGRCCLRRGGGPCSRSSCRTPCHPRSSRSSRPRPRHPPEADQFLPALLLELHGDVGVGAPPRERGPAADADLAALALELADDEAVHERARPSDAVAEVLGTRTGVIEREACRMCRDSLRARDRRPELRRHLRHADPPPMSIVEGGEIRAPPFCLLLLPRRAAAPAHRGVEGRPSGAAGSGVGARQGGTRSVSGQQLAGLPC